MDSFHQNDDLEAVPPLSEASGCSAIEEPPRRSFFSGRKKLVAATFSIVVVASIATGVALSVKPSRQTGIEQSSVAITNNEISTSATKIKLYNEKYGAEIESMEGGAFHYVAIMKSISFIQLRGISNYVGDRDKNNWKIKEAIISYSDVCNQLIKKLMLSK